MTTYTHITNYINRLLQPLACRLTGDDTANGGEHGNHQPSGSEKPVTPVTPAAPAAPGGILAYIKDDGTLAPGWAQAIGAPAAFEGKFTSLKAAFGAHGNLEQMLGRDRLVLPGEHSSPEEWATFYQKLGRPQHPGDYALKRPDHLPPECWSDERSATFAAKAHELGLTTRQVQSLVEWELGNVGQTLRTHQQQQQVARADAINTLKLEWGRDYDRKLLTARNAARHVGGEALLSDPVLANHPTLIKALARVGEMIREDTGLPGGRDEQGRFANDPKTEIKAIMGNKNDPYWAGDRDRLAHVQQLYARAYPQS